MSLFGKSHLAWSEADNATAVRMRAEGKTIQKIGEALSRTPSAVKCQLERIDNAKIKFKYQTRRCLCCGKNFPSAGAHNRLCLDCRRKDLSPYTPL